MEIKKTFRIKKEENPDQFTREYKPVEIEVAQAPQKIKVSLAELKANKARFQEMIKSLDADIKEVEKLLG